MGLVSGGRAAGFLVLNNSNSVDSNISSRCLSLRSYVTIICVFKSYNVVYVLLLQFENLMDDVSIRLNIFSCKAEIAFYECTCR